MSRQNGSFLSLIFCIIGFYVSSVSCNRHQDHKTSKTHDSTIVAQIIPSRPIDSLGSRWILIKKLKKLKSVFGSNVENQIRIIFHYPVPDSIISLGISLDDSAFRLEYEKNKGLTEDMFIKHFKMIYRDWRLNELNKLFRYLPLDSLQQKDTLKYYDADKKEPCLKQYFLIVKDSLVMITYGTNGNPGYKGKKSDDEIGDECEYDTYWEFLFDGKTLVFKRQVVAG